MVEMAGEDSGGFHLRGSSSTGKTTALRVAASVYGEPHRYVRTWRATSNGLEGIAAVHNDGLLILDELHQCDPKEAGEVCYMLGNGQGKARASHRHGAQTPYLAAVVPVVGRAIVRCATRQHWEAFDGRTGSRACRDSGGCWARHGDHRDVARLEGLGGAGGAVDGGIPQIPRRCRKGMAQGPSAVPRQGNGGTAQKRLDGTINEITDGKDAGGQAGRVARRIALAAIQGDLATRYGLTGWPEGEAVAAAKACYAAWLEGFGGTGNRDERALLAQVRGFIEAHGGSRFEPVAGADPDRRTLYRDRVGFTKGDGQGAILYLVLPEAFRKEVVKGFDPKWSAEVLERNDHLVAQGDRKTCMERIPAMGGTHRVYVLKVPVEGGGP